MVPQHEVRGALHEEVVFILFEALDLEGLHLAAIAVGAVPGPHQDLGIEVLERGARSEWPYEREIGPEIFEGLAARRQPCVAVVVGRRAGHAGVLGREETYLARYRDTVGHFQADGVCDSLFPFTT